VLAAPEEGCNARDGVAVTDAVTTGLVIVPTYNEALNVGRLLPRILAQDSRLHVLIVDDSSPDGTHVLVETMARRETRVSALVRPRKEGLGKAYKAGFSAGLAGSYDVFITMDADLSHQPEHLPVMLQEAARADVVIGSRYVPGGGTENWALHRRILSRAGNAYARTVLGLPIRDCSSGFVLYRRRVLESIALNDIRSEGYSFLMELKHLAHRAGFSMRESPIVFIERAGGKSKISKAILLEALWVVWRLRWTTR
jgi:dolichol-phosphate mannosyltransferase